METLDVLYDHYKETFSLSKEAQGRRNKSFLVLCILEAFSFLILIRPEKAFKLILDGINLELDSTLQISNTIIQTLLWLLIAYVMIRYIQDVLYVERQYMYLNKLEKEISNNMTVNIFSREGDHYLHNYPMVLNFIDLFYKMLMPIFFGVINIVRIYKEWKSVKGITIAIIADTVLCVAILIIIWFYFFEIHSKITDFCKKHIPLVDKIACGLRKVLKEV